MDPDDQFTLALTAVLLRPSVDPVSAWTDDSRPGVEFYQYFEDKLQALNREDAQLIGAASSPGDVIIAFFRRPRAPVAWLRFLRERAGLQVVVANGDSFGAAVFCAIEDEANAADGLSWVAWLFGNASRSIRRSAQDPRFGLRATLNLLSAIRRDEDEGEVIGMRNVPRVREMRYRSYNPYVQQTGHRAVRCLHVDERQLDPFVVIDRSLAKYPPSVTR